MQQAVVVVLAGGFSSTIASELSTVSPDVFSGEAATIKGLKPTTLGKYAGKAYVTPSLVTVNDQPALIHTLRALQAVRRTSLSEVWIVHNECDSAHFVGPDGIFDEPPASDIAIPNLNFVSNGASQPSDYKGEVHDLQLALRKANLQGHMVVAISGSLTFVPSYNMQRLFEHSFVRGKACLGTSILSPAEHAVLGDTGYTVVTPAQEVAVPPLASLVHDAYASPGTEVAEPLLVLMPSQVEGVMQSSAPSLIALAADMMEQQVVVCGITLMHGKFTLRTAASLDYADRFFAFAARRLMDPHSGGSGEPVGQSFAEFTATSKAFNTSYFEDPTRKRTAPGMKEYLLPPTFYMTAYRRQAADIML